MKRAARNVCALLAGTATVLATAATAGAGPTVWATPPGVQTFTIYHPPNGTPGQHTAEEPSIGADWTTGAVMYQSLLTTLRVTFDDSTTPAVATWRDVSPRLTTRTSLDPILFTDHATNRTFVSQDIGQGSISEYSNDDGATWTPDQGGGVGSAFDHPTVGAGRFAPLPLPNPVYPDATYYCAQAVVAATCALSPDGGVTYGPAVPIYSAARCTGIHGHVRVAPDGTAIVPNQNCSQSPKPAKFDGVMPNQAAVISKDNGAAWTVHVIPDSTSTLRSDPSVAADSAGRLYFGYENELDNTASGTQVGGRAEIAISTDDGQSWSWSVNVGAPLGVQNVTFPEVIAGDAGRAAFAFLGSTTSGDPEMTSFQGVWDLYVAFTYDGGASWRVSDLTPGAPVERGCIFLSGFAGPGLAASNCPSAASLLQLTSPSQGKQNLRDFMDITVDEHGRVLVGFAYGCTGTCQTDLGQPCQDAGCSTGPTASTDSFASIARETCGEGLIARYDSSLACTSPLRW